LFGNDFIGICGKISIRIVKGGFLKFPIMKEIKTRNSFIFILLFIIFIISFTFITGHNEENQKIDYFLVELTDKYRNNSKYIFEVEYEGEKYAVEVKEDTYDNYGINSILNAYFDKKKLYLAGISVDEPFKTKAHR